MMPLTGQATYLGMMKEGVPQPWRALSIIRSASLSLTVMVADGEGGQSINFFSSPLISISFLIVMEVGIPGSGDHPTSHGLIQ